MGVTITVTGKEGLARLARALRDLDEKDLRLELLRGLRKASKPMVPAARAAALTGLPKRGGLAADVAGAKWGVQTRLGGQGTGVRIVGAWSSDGKQHDLAKMDSGVIRHPVWDHREAGRKWEAQTAGVTAGWFSNAMQALAPEFRDEIQNVMDEITDKLAAKV